MPKKSKTNKISYFKPIGLVTTLYNIIVKVLSRRNQKVLHKSIYISQGAFVGGVTNFGCCFDFVNEMENGRRHLRGERVILKIDFEKVYGHVD